MNQEGIWSLVSAERMRQLDAQTISSWGVSADVLMESAGRAVVDAILSHWSAHVSARDAQVVVLCGVGHNGGDGLVVARHLALLGYRVRSVLVGPASTLSPLSAVNAERARAVGVRIETGEGELPEHGVLVDALLGTGLSRDLRDASAKWVQRINEAAGPRLKVVSIDMPTGIHSETGQVLGSAVRADLTVTIGSPKIGLTLEPGRSHAGEIRVARIGIADTLPATDPQAAQAPCRMWSSWAATRHFPLRPASGRVDQSRTLGLRHDAARTFKENNAIGLLRQAPRPSNPIGIDFCGGDPKQSRRLAGMRGEHGGGRPSPEHGDLFVERIQPIRIQDQREGSLTHNFQDQLPRLRVSAEARPDGENIFPGGQFQSGFQG